MNETIVVSLVSSRLFQALVLPVIPSASAGLFKKLNRLLWKGKPNCRL